MAERHITRVTLDWPNRRIWLEVDDEQFAFSAEEAGVLLHDLQGALARYHHAVEREDQGQRA